ncbi:MAG: class I SAM-dependent DNA methyltransferase [Solirubrobacteraceae bacterium]
MSEHDPTAYGAAIGPDFDALYPDSHESLQTDATVAFLASLAGGGGRSGAVLEFGVGTGRVALGLLERGVDVSGIEESTAMLARLIEKPRGREVEVVVGDFVSARINRTFDVVVVTMNAIFAPGSRADQAACFRNAARHLEPGGFFVVEAYVLQPDQLGGAWSIWPRSVTADHVELQLARYDLPTSRVQRMLVHLRSSGVRLVEVNDTYAWPSELDLMAEAAGFELHGRTGDWRGEPFAGSSVRHVSVYRLKDVGSRYPGSG